MIGKNITLKNTEVIVEESKVVFHQETSFLIKPYFRENLFINYDIDLSEVPVSILNIPFVANIYPMCWFLGATLKVKSLDKNFFESIEKVKQEFAKFYPEILFRNSKLIVEQLEETNHVSNNKAMLFSGGVDALYTYSRLDNQDVKLITIHGADIEIQNVSQWEKIKSITKSLELTKSNPYFFIKSNVRRFYRSKTEKLIFNNNQDWWTLIQHGLSLTSLIAPIAYKNNIGEIYIGSTLDTSKDFLPWGSSYIDNYIAWASTQVIHHGQEANRFTKMRLLCDYFQEKKIPTPFRVCYYNKNTKGSTSSLVYYNENAQLNDIIKTKENLIKEQGKNRLEIINFDKVIKEVSSVTNIKNVKSINGKLKFVAPFLLIFIFLISSMLLKFYQKLKVKYNK